MARQQHIVDEWERQGQKREASKSLAPLKALKPFLLPYRSMILAAGIALVVAAAASLVMPIAVRGVIDHGFSAEDASNIRRYFLALIGVVAVMAMASATRFYLVTWIGERVTADVRTHVFAHVLGLSPSFFEVTRTGEVLSRLTADTTLVQTVVGSSASFALRNLVLAIGSIVMMAVTSPKRLAAAPELPTAIEAGYPQLEFEGLQGFFGPRGMPAERQDRIDQFLFDIGGSRRRLFPVRAQHMCRKMLGDETHFARRRTA
jgi:ABC-type multidrug transport system fused ATPase/permease subunit